MQADFPKRGGPFDAGAMFSMGMPMGSPALGGLGVMGGKKGPAAAFAGMGAAGFPPYAMAGYPMGMGGPMAMGAYPGMPGMMGMVSVTRASRGTCMRVVHAQAGRRRAHGFNVNSPVPCSPCPLRAPWVWLA